MRLWHLCFIVFSFVFKNKASLISLPVFTSLVRLWQRDLNLDWSWLQGGKVVTGLLPNLSDRYIAYKYKYNYKYKYKYIHIYK